MKLLAVTSQPYPFWGGAALTDVAFLQRLAAEHSWECHMAVGNSSRRRHKCGLVRIRRGESLEELRHIVLELRPDVMFCTLNAIPNAVRLARRYGVPCLAYLHSYELCPPSPSQARRWRVGKSPIDKDEAARALGQADAVASNSRYMQSHLKAALGLDSTVLYPEFLPARFLLRQARRPRYITAVAGLPHKGCDIFVELARRFPTEPFRLVGAVLPRVRRALAELPNVELLNYGDPRGFLQQTRVLLAPAQWAEPFGRMAVEAMANGIPTLVSLHGGLQEIAGTTSLGVRHFRSPAAWAEHLRQLLTDSTVATRNAAEGSRQAAGFLEGRSAAQLSSWLKTLASEKVPDFKSRLRVGWRGEVSERTAHTMLNAQWVQRGAGLAVSSSGPQDVPWDVVVHHDYQEPFRHFVAPAEGKLVAFRTWDFGRYPSTWVERINKECDQLWVYSRHTRKQAVASGISPRRVKVIPPGVDLETFSPDGPRYALGTGKAQHLLFVGASIYRKGIDTLLEAFTRAFNAADDVCLVIKDRPDDLFYEGQDYSERIADIAGRAGAPKILHLRCFLTRAQLASLYRACSVSVFPYRGEGFALPILESMACGVPAIVPAGGPCLDFCNRHNAYLVPTTFLRLPVRGEFSINSLGATETLSEVSFFETSAKRLAETMRAALRVPSRLAQRGELARRTAERFSWENSLGAVARALEELRSDVLPRRIVASQQVDRRRERVLRAAREMIAAFPNAIR
jgi:glycosyltransferase involved in cell wall biosynthesis